jgi:DEAD/DEAH box helicase domain-containing protein
MISTDDIIGNRHAKAMVVARLGDSNEEVTGSDYCERWRRFLASTNLHQFCCVFEMWATSECAEGFSPEIPFEAEVIADEWQAVADEVASSIRQYVQAMALQGLPVPVVEYYHDDLAEDAFAELAWPDAAKPIAILVGDQESFAGKWQQLGWTVVVPADVQSRGVAWLVETIADHAGHRDPVSGPGKI